MITGYFGLPGAGKTTMLAMFASRENKKIKKGKSKYKRVLTNFQCKGCYKVNFDMLGNVDLSDSLILIDEITLFADSRDFKKFSQQMKEFFILHRHYHIDIIYFCQQYDGLDKKIRDCTAELWYCKKFFWWTKAKRIYRILDICEQTKEIVFGYRFPCMLERLFNIFLPMNVTKTCFRPKYYKYFDSYDKIPLPNVDYELW